MKRLQTAAVASVLAFACASAAAAGDPVAGKEVAQTCVACHGADGNSVAPTFPHLAGQYADYMVRALEDYRAGVRSNPIMMPMAQALTDQQIEDVSAYFAAQKGSLFTIQYSHD